MCANVSSPGKVNLCFLLNGFYKVPMLLVYLVIHSFMMAMAMLMMTMVLMMMAMAAMTVMVIMINLVVDSGGKILSFQSNILQLPLPLLLPLLDSLPVLLEPLPMPVQPTLGAACLLLLDPPLLC